MVNIRRPETNTARSRVYGIIFASMLVAPLVSGWVATSSSRYNSRTFLSEVLDVDFERVNEMQPQRLHTEDSYEETRTLLDLSFDSDPKWKEARVPFVDGENYIDTKLAFTAELDGVTYGIGVPFEPAAALAFESSDGSVSYLSPDEEENEELMQLMAVQLREHVCEDLRLKRTPRVLTISGPLANFTKNWKENILPGPVDKEFLLDDDTGEDLTFFHNFMKQELGEEEYGKTLQESSDWISDGLMSLFDIPGLGTNEDDVEGMENMVKSILDTEAQMKELAELDGPNFEHEGALKLVSYIVPDGKSYSLVQLLKPYVLVGKLIESEGDTHFELISADEAPIIVPRLEEICRKEFQKAGVTS
jgi:hypothetical protein